MLKRSRSIENITDEQSINLWDLRDKPEQENEEKL
jgi:hypothetical protein